MQLNMNKDSQDHISKAILVGIVTRDNSADEVEKELDELARLLDTAGGEEFARLVQNKETPDPRTVICSGKVYELSELCRNNGVKLVIFDTRFMQESFCIGIETFTTQHPFVSGKIKETGGVFCG